MAGAKAGRKCIDLTGQRFGRWTVIRRLVGKGRPRWRCRCDCGNFGAVNGSTLRAGSSTQCVDCRNKQLVERMAENRNRTPTELEIGWQRGTWTLVEKRSDGMFRLRCRCGNEVVRDRNATVSGRVVQSCSQCRPKSFMNLTGQKFGKWTAIEYVGRKSNQSMWRCQCECGKKQVVGIGNLRSCLSTQCARCSATERRKYGDVGANSRVAATWRDLRTKNILSEEWYDFERYVTDISASPKFARFAARTDTPLYLDRIDYEKPFGPENFLFSSIRKQRIKRSHGKIDLETYTQIFGAMTRLDRMKALREAKEKGYTLLQLGRLLNVTRERVRQIIRSQPTPRMLKEAAWRPSNRQRAVFNLWQAGLDTRDISTKINIPFRAVARIRAGLKKRNVPLRKRNEDHARNFARLVSQTAPPGPSPVCDPSVETPVGGGSD